jgi:hypothetical protein
MRSNNAKDVSKLGIDWKTVYSPENCAKKMPDSTPFTQGFNSIFWLSITPIFVDFYERHRPWVEQNHSGKACPPTFYFARMVRNAVSHGGKPHFTRDPNRSANWHHFKFAYSDRETPIIGAGGILSPADLFFLMLDTSDELDVLACPLKPA